MELHALVLMGFAPKSFSRSDFDFCQEKIVMSNVLVAPSYKKDPLAMDEQAGRVAKQTPFTALPWIILYNDTSPVTKDFYKIARTFYNIPIL